MLARSQGWPPGLFLVCLLAGPVAGPKVGAQAGPLADPKACHSAGPLVGPLAAQPSVMTIAVINVILTFALPIYEGRQDEAQNMARPGL